MSFKGKTCGLPGRLDHNLQFKYPNITPKEIVLHSADEYLQRKSH